MNVLMDSYVGIKKVKLNSLVFEFDGDLLSGMESPPTLEQEGGECIEIKTKTKQREHWKHILQGQKT